MRRTSTHKWSGMQVERPKQARRRLHACVPHQVKVRNMAEARKEIAMALKFHRESMRQATEQRTKQEKKPALEHSKYFNSAPSPQSLPTHVLHPAMGEEEMAEIRSMSDRLEMEWNDMVNSMRSAWWSNVLKNVSGDCGVSKEEEHLFRSLDEIFHLQAWFGSCG